VALSCKRRSLRLIGREQQPIFGHGVFDLWRCLDFARVSAHNYSRVHRGTGGCKATLHSLTDELQRFVLELRGLLFKLCSDLDTFMELRASPLGPNRPSNRDHLIQSCYIALNNNSRSAVDIYLQMLNVTPPKCSQTDNASWQICSNSHSVVSLSPHRWHSWCYLDWRRQCFCKYFSIF